MFSIHLVEVYVFKILQETTSASVYVKVSGGKKFTYYNRTNF